MTIYIDVLIVVNIIVDYFLLKLSAFFLKREIPLFRMVLGSVLGGAFSLYILLPKTLFLVETSVRVLMSATLVLVTFGFLNLKAFLRATFCLYFVTLCFGGVMFALWYFLAPNGMVINNSVVYFNISPVVLILSSGVYYVAVMLIKTFTKKNFALSKSYEVTLVLFGESLKITAIADTGNSLTDVFGNCHVIVVSKNIADVFLENTDKEKLNSRYRAVPCKSVSGDSLLKGYRLDRAYITEKEKTIKADNVIMAVSKGKIDGEYGGILNPEILL